MYHTNVKSPEEKKDYKDVYEGDQKLWIREEPEVA